MIIVIVEGTVHARKVWAVLLFCSLLVSALRAEIIQINTKNVCFFHSFSLILQTESTNWNDMQRYYLIGWLWICGVMTRLFVTLQTESTNWNDMQRYYLIGWLWICGVMTVLGNPVDNLLNRIDPGAARKFKTELVKDCLGRELVLEILCGGASHMESDAG